MEKNGQIFLNNDSEKSSSTPEQIKYVHNTQSDEFISQFLYDQGSHSLSAIKHQSAPILLQKIHQINDQYDQKPQNLKKKSKRQKSLFHNFQKHLVITLKKIVRIKSKPEDGLIPKIADQMWQIFLKSHLYTKTILHILYGAEQEQQQCSFTSAMLNRFGYVDLFNKYSQDLVKQAQQYLRQETVKAVKRVNIKQYLGKRRLSKAEQFQDYLNQFIQQLSQGPIKRRIPKQKKQNLKVYQKNLKKTQSIRSKHHQNHNNKNSHRYRNDLENKSQMQAQKVEVENQHSIQDQVIKIEQQCEIKKSEEQ